MVKKIPKISVIVPVYNAEKYLRRCIESVLCQTFEDFELILVDDGSSDNSGRICDEYATIDDRIIVIHKANGGASDARNVGIDRASGEYIMFCDSDDYIRDTMLEQMQEKLSEDIDLVVASLKMVTQNGHMDYCMPDKTYSVKELIEMFCMSAFPIICLCGPCNKLYRKSIIEENGIRFDVSLTVGEDTHFNMQYILKSKYVFCMSEIYYFYVRDNENSLFSKFRSCYYEDAKKVYELKKKTAEELQCSDKAIDTLTKIYVSGFIPNLFKAIKTADRKICIEYMRKINTDTLFCDNIEMFRGRCRDYLFAMLIKKKCYEAVYVMGRLWLKIKSYRKVL